MSKQAILLPLGMIAFLVVGMRPDAMIAPLAARADSVTVEPEVYTEQLLDRLNAERGAAGLGAFSLSDDVDDVAIARSVDMARWGYFSHVSPSGSDAYALLRQRGIAFSRMGENIAETSYPPNEMVDIVHSALMASPGHRANIMEASYHRVGIGVASVSGSFYVTFVFLD